MALKANKYALEELLRSSAWADLRDILHERLEGNLRELEVEVPDEDIWIGIRRVAALRARIGELRYLEILPEFILEHYEELVKIEEGEKDARRSE